MLKNRLRLDFSLETAEERLQFLNSYLPTINFEPNEHEQETLSDYLLWGKNSQGLNSQQDGSVVIKEWTTSKVDSIEGLIETPGFQETKLKRLGSTHYKTPRATFSREEILSHASDTLKPTLLDLFQQIDQIELLINYYELFIGKRKTEPRQQLLNQFQPDELEKLKTRGTQLTQYQYLKLRHRLVELRTEQYTYKDFIMPTIMPRQDIDIQEETQIRFGTDIQVRPLGLHDNSLYSQKIFAPEPNPFLFNEDDLKKLSDYFWMEKPPSKFYLDFENTEHLLALYRQYNELRFEAEQDPDQIYSSAASIFRTLDFYEQCARLNEIQREILHMKIKQFQNCEIAIYINKKYSTTYNDNYISTIYRKKILFEVAQAATLHKQIIENIFYPENFKKCKDCGRLLLRVPELFMRQHKAPDGFSPRCKECQKKKRIQEKNKYEIKYITIRPNNENATN